MPARFFPLLCAALLAFGVHAADDDTDDFKRWAEWEDIQAFEQYLSREKVGGVVPTRQLVRTASDWRKCGGPRFEIPPPSHWHHVREVLELVAELKKRGILDEFEAVSSYRNPRLNRCAGGAKRSSHAMAFALDIYSEGRPVNLQKLCSFWREEGKDWKMGLSRYPSGRIHLDRSGWRTWGASHGKGSSLCLEPQSVAQAGR